MKDPPHPNPLPRGERERTFRADSSHGLHLDITPHPRGALRPSCRCFSRPKRAWGMPGGQRTRSLAWKNENHTSVVTAGIRRFHPAFPHANGFNGFLRALLGEPGLFATIPSATRKRCRRVNASVGASGPHDFAVRRCTVRLTAQPRPPHPAPNVRDDRETPLLRARNGGVYGFDLGKTRRDLFLQRGLDR
jgi:hypothetical protein